MKQKRLWVVTLLVALLAGLLATVKSPLVADRSKERLSNGDFEEGFRATQVGPVGDGWNWFHNGGRSNVSFYEDTWAPVVYDGTRSQLLGISTYDMGAVDAGVLVGIYQTVAVQPGATYEFSLRGMLRAREDDPDRSGHNYRVVYGFDLSGGDYWKAVPEWAEVPWNTVHPMLSPGSMESFTTSITATGNRLTLFVGLLKKWATGQREVVANLDAISLQGAMPVDVDGPADEPTYTVVTTGEAGYTVLENTMWTDADKLAVGFVPPQFPVAGWTQTVQVVSSNDVGVTQLEFFDDDELVGRRQLEVGRLNLVQDYAWTPQHPGLHVLRAVAYDAAGARAVFEAEVHVGSLGQFLTNRGFELGFDKHPVGMVGTGWHWFHNGGHAVYGFYDDTWAPVVYGGRHSQLIEINTFGADRAEPDRYAGIYQTVKGLTTGATYQFQVRGMIRALASDPDREGYNYRVQWGYLPGGGTDWQKVDNWAEIPWDTVYERTDPGEINSYTGTFEAPATEITLFVRVWKKWGTLNREVDVNLDGLGLRGYK
jgi:hypothetical protein